MIGSYSGLMVNASVGDRAAFVKRTYLHLALAIISFIVMEFLLLNSPIAVMFMSFISSGMSWFFVLIAFMGVSYIADNWARNTTSLKKQYAGLFLYVFAEAVIFIPLLLIASRLAPDAIFFSGILTFLLFLGITFSAFTSGKDFSFLSGILRIGGIVALGFVGLSLIFGMSLGIFFSFLMVGFASVAILYNTSNIIHHYRSDQYVSAALSLFASVALLFWYILQILLHFGGFSSD